MDIVNDTGSCRSFSSNREHNIRSTMAIKNKMGVSDENEVSDNFIFYPAVQ